MKKPKLPRHVLFHHDLRLLVWRPLGLLNEKAVNNVITFVGDEEVRSHKPFNRFTDTLLVDAVDLNFRYIFHVALYRRLASLDRLPVKSAILVTDETIAYYGRIHATITRGSPLEVRLFEQRELAAEWLGVSLESLEY